MAAVTQTVNYGAPIASDAEVITASPLLMRQSVSADPAPRARLLARLSMMQQWWILEGGDGDCPDETDLDLVQDNPIQ